MQPGARFWGLWAWWLEAVEWSSRWNSGFLLSWAAEDPAQKASPLRLDPRPLVWSRGPCRE